MSDADEDDIYIVERILADDEVDGEVFYLVKWEGYDDAECTWEPASSFTSVESVEEFRKQKDAGLSLPDDFLVALQKKMDDFQSGNQQTGSAAEQLNEDNTEANQPTKKQKLMDNTATKSKTQNLSSSINVPRKKGIAKPVKKLARKISAQTKSTPARAAKTDAQIKKPLTTTTTPNSRNASAQKAGQRFRNLSHMNNYRKKTRMEPVPNLAPGKLKTIEDFDIGQDDIRMLQPMIGDAPQHGNESPLFIPDTNATELLGGLSPARSESVLFPPAEVDHQQHTRTTGPKIHTDSRNSPRQRQNVVAIENNAIHHGVPISKNFPQAPMPDKSLQRYAHNGRMWYYGDLVCKFTCGRCVGDATIVHVPFHPYGSRIVRLKVRDSLNLVFEAQPFNPEEFRQAFQNYEALPQEVGLISPFEDTQQDFDAFADHLERFDSVAIFHYPDAQVDMSLLMYSLHAPSWGFLGWKPARTGKPRLHVAFLPKLIPRNTQHPSRPNDFPSSVHPARLPMTTTEQIANNTFVPHDRTRRQSSTQQRSASPSLAHEVAVLDIKQVETPTSPSVLSDPDTSFPGSPLLGSISYDTSPLTMTPGSPQVEQALTRDPRLKRKISHMSVSQNVEKEEISNVKVHESSRKLNYRLLISSYILNPNVKLDHRDPRFFIAFAESDPTKAAAIQDWLEKHRVASSSIYLDSQRHDWVRFKEKAVKTVSVLLFDDANLNYHQLPGLGQILMTEPPTCFSLIFKNKDSTAADLSTVRIKKLFPRMSTYLITESMITQNLEETMAVVKYFDHSKKSGYKMMMRPNIERWLLEYAAKEGDDIRRGKLIDFLLLIRNLRPKSDEPTEIDEVEKMRMITGNTAQDPSDFSYIVCPSRIPGYDEALPPSNSVFQPYNRDDIFKAYFYCYAATKADETRRFLAFYNKKEADRHTSIMTKKEKDKTLDCGHVIFYELEKFVGMFCHRSEQRETHGNDAAATHSPLKTDASAQPT